MSSSCHSHQTHDNYIQLDPFAVSDRSRYTSWLLFGRKKINNNNEDNDNEEEGGIRGTVVARWTTVLQVERLILPPGAWFIAKFISFAHVIPGPV